MSEEVGKKKVFVCMKRKHRNTVESIEEKDKRIKNVCTSIQAADGLYHHGKAAPLVGRASSVLFLFSLAYT